MGKMKRKGEEEEDWGEGGRSEEKEMGEESHRKRFAGHFSFASR